MPSLFRVMLLLCPVAVLLLWGGLALRAQAEALVWDNSSSLIASPVVSRWPTLQGFYSTTSLTNNTLTIEPGKNLGGTAFGGVSISNDVSGNYTYVQLGATLDIVYAGFSESGTASDNHLVIRGGTLKAGYGGGTGTGMSLNNSITLEDGTVTDVLSGGPGHDSGDASGNKVFVKGGSVGIDVAGAATARGTITNNHVVITGGVVSNSAVGRVMGGEVWEDGTMSKNTVTISGGTVNGTTYGGMAVADGTATENAVYVSGGTVQGLMGGYARRGDAKLNSVVVTGGTVKNDVSGGSVETGTAEGNTVLLTGGRMEKVVHGGKGVAATVKGNTVEVGSDDAAGTAAVVLSSVYGGYQTGSTGSVAENTVTLSGRGEVRGYVAGGQGSLLAEKNVVNMRAGEVRGDVYGGKADGGRGKAQNNVVNLYGGIVGRNIYGGYAAGGTATNNTVNLYSGNFANSAIYGGWSDPRNGGGDHKSGNTLNVFSKGLTVRNVGNFANYNFIMPVDIMPGDTMLSVVDPNDFVTDMENTNVGVGKIGGGMLLKPGDRINLITNRTAGIDTAGLVGHTIRGQHGVSVEYDFTVLTDPDAVYITVGRVPAPTPNPPNPPGPPSSPDSGPNPPDPADPAPNPPDPTPNPGTPAPPVLPVQPGTGVRINPATKAFAEAKVALLAFVGEGSGVALKGALSAQPRQEDPWGLNAFIIASGSSMRHTTGAHVDLTGTNMAAGVSSGGRLAGGRVLLGAFVEAGMVRYATYNDFSDRPSVEAKGKGRYYGGGLLAHYTQVRPQQGKQEKARGFHVEATLRAGNMEMDFVSNDMRDVLGRRARYETSAPYVGGHVGMGYVWELGSQTTLDTYTELHVTHLGANRFRVLGDPIRMEAATALRWRTGLKLEHQWNDKMRGYVGAAYQHAFDGVVRGKAYHLRIPQTQLQGSAGLGEVGLNIRPGGEEGAFSADISAHGAVGQQQGLGGEILMVYEF